MPKKKAEEGAPAYMAQFTALMTILLAFFITMLTLGTNRVSKYKQEGFGQIRDAFGGGSQGGLGLLPFMKSLMRHYPEVKKDDLDEEAKVLGYEKGSFESEVFDAEGIARMEIVDVGFDIRIGLPVAFRNGGMQLSEEGRQSLGRIGGVLQGLTNHMITVCCYDRTQPGMESKIKAAKRSAVIVKFLVDNCSVPEDRLVNVGYADSRYLEVAGQDWGDSPVVFVVRKKVSKTSSSML